MFKQIHKDSLYYGFPVTLLATQSIDGTDNISPISSSWTLNNHVVLGVSLGGKLIKTCSQRKKQLSTLPIVKFGPISSVSQEQLENHILIVIKK